MSGNTEAVWFSPEDVASLSQIVSAGFALDDELIYYLCAQQESQRDVTRLWLHHRVTGDNEQFSVPGSQHHALALSPDGCHLAFVALYGDHSTLCILDLRTKLTSQIETGLHQMGDVSWSPDGESIALVHNSAPARDRTMPFRVTRETYRYDGIGWIDDALQDVAIVDVHSGEVRRITTSGALLSAPRWSPRGDRIAYLSAFEQDGPWRNCPTLCVVDVASGSCSDLLRAWGQIHAYAWDSDARIVLAGVAQSVEGSYFRKRDLWVLDVQSGQMHCRTRCLPSGVGHHLEIDSPGLHQRISIVKAAHGKVLISAQERAGVAVVEIDLENGSALTVVEGDGRACFLADRDRAGALLYSVSSLLEPPELTLAENGLERPVTALHAAMAARSSRPKVEQFTVTAEDGTESEAWALVPALKASGREPVPSVLCIHGGPDDAYGHAFMIDFHLLASAGIAVVFGNFRGSGGYGDAFHAALGMDWGELGALDHLATMAMAVELGIADPARLGVYGISHGGFATCWLLSQTDLFKAGVAENPAINWVSLYGTMDGPDIWFERELGSTPSRGWRHLEDRSPLTHAAGCSAPLLLIIGEDDLRCPPTEAEQFYRAAMVAGGEVEMLRLPGSSHLGSWIGPAKVRAAQNDALLDWFTRHLMAQSKRQSAGG